MSKSGTVPDGEERMNPYRRRDRKDRSVTMITTATIRLYDAPIRAWVGDMKNLADTESTDRFRAWTAVLSDSELWPYIVAAWGSYGIQRTMVIHASAQELLNLVAMWEAKTSLSGS